MQGPRIAICRGPGQQYAGTQDSNMQGPRTAICRDNNTQGVYKRLVLHKDIHSSKVVCHRRQSVSHEAITK